MSVGNEYGKFIYVIVKSPEPSQLYSPRNKIYEFRQEKMMVYIYKFNSDDKMEKVNNNHLITIATFSKGGMFSRDSFKYKGWEILEVFSKSYFYKDYLLNGPEYFEFYWKYLGFLFQILPSENINCFFDIYNPSSFFRFNQTRYPISFITAMGLEDDYDISIAFYFKKSKKTIDLDPDPIVFNGEKYPRINCQLTPNTYNRFIIYYMGLPNPASKFVEFLNNNLEFYTDSGRALFTTSSNVLVFNSCLKKLLLNEKLTIEHLFKILFNHPELPTLIDEPNIPILQNTKSIPLDPELFEDIIILVKEINTKNTQLLIQLLLRSFYITSYEVVSKNRDMTDLFNTSIVLDKYKELLQPYEDYTYVN